MHWVREAKLAGQPAWVVQRAQLRRDRFRFCRFCRWWLFAAAAIWFYAAKAAVFWCPEPRWFDAGLQVDFVKSLRRTTNAPAIGLLPPADGPITGRLIKPGRAPPVWGRSIANRAPQNIQAYQVH